MPTTPQEIDSFLDGVKRRDKAEALPTPGATRGDTNLNSEIDSFLDARNRMDSMHMGLRQHGRQDIFLSDNEMTPKHQ